MFGGVCVVFGLVSVVVDLVGCGVVLRGVWVVGWSVFVGLVGGVWVVLFFCGLLGCVFLYSCFLVGVFGFVGCLLSKRSVHCLVCCSVLFRFF